MSRKKLIDATINELMDFCMSHDCMNCVLYKKFCGKRASVYTLIFNKGVDKIEIEVKDIPEEPFVKPFVKVELNNDSSIPNCLWNSLTKNEEEKK